MTEVTDVSVWFIRQWCIMGNVMTQRCSMWKESDPELIQNSVALFGPQTLLKLLPLQDRDHGDQHHNISDLNDPEGRRRPEADLVKRCRRKLIGGIRWVDTILDILFKDRILSTANVDAISIYAVQREKKRVLVDLVLRKGNEAQEALYKTLVRLDPVLLQELDLQPIRKQVSSRVVSDHHKNLHRTEIQSKRSIRSFPCSFFTRMSQTDLSPWTCWIFWTQMN